jgi:CelD/BcsL family acetyltransferase involved in cellulose biosynthesis
MIAEVQDRPGAAHETTMRIALADPEALPSAEAWANLEQAALEPNPFFAHWFLKPALAHLAEGRAIRLATLWTGERLDGLMPLTIRQNYGRMPAPHVSNWAHYQCFMGTPLIRGGMEAAYWEALIRALDEAEWASGLLSVTHLDPGGSVFAGLTLAAAKLGRPCPIVHSQQRAMLRSSLSPEAYLETHVRGKKRKEWRRLESRLGEMGVVEYHKSPQRKPGSIGDFTRVCEPDAAQPPDFAGATKAATEFLTLEAAGWKGARGAALGNTDQTRDFFRAMLAGAAQAGTLDMQSLTLDGKPIAMLVNFLTPPGSWSFKIAHDENWARYSPGVMIELRNLAAVLGNPKLEWMDSCAVENHPMINSLWAERRDIVQVSVPLSGIKRAVTWHLCRAAENASATLRKRIAK